MSTLKVSEIQNAATTAGGISIDSSGAVSGGLPTPNRNLLYNGAMQVAQRGTSVTGNTAGGYLTADRWKVLLSSLGTWTQTVENDAPTGSGFRKSTKMLVTTADSTPSGGDLCIFSQPLEGQDLQRVAKGTASAKSLTVSFWVKSNVTGTFVVELGDDANGRYCSAAYTVNASATWERKTVTFPADTTGAIANDNATGLILLFWLGAGSTYTSGTIQSGWQTTAANRAAGQTNLAAATNNYWQVTGVQLEVGDTATEFEHLPFGVELARCQRYYEIVSNGATGTQRASTSPGATLSYPFKVSKRVAPTAATHIGNYTIGCPGLNGPFTVSAASVLQAATTTGALVDVITTGNTGTNGSIALITSSTEASGIGFSAEL